MQIRWMIAIAGVGFAVGQTAIMGWMAGGLPPPMLIAGGVLTVVAGGIGFVIGTILGRRLDQARQALEAAEAGDLSRRVAVGFNDELGRLGRSLNHTIGTLAEQRQKLGGVVAQRVDGINDAASALNATSAELMEGAENNTEEAQRVASAAEQVSANAHHIAASAEEMNATVREIASTTTEASRVSGEAATRSSDVDAAVKRLARSSSDIGSVVQTISDIAAQTNLLALNATIEAARAGEAGRGFAVVASEVKLLAQQTTTATADISQRITAIQQDIEQATGAIADIAKLIGRSNELQQTVASAVEEQSATTAEMSRSIGEAAKGSGDIAKAIAAVANAARISCANALTVKDLGEQLTADSEQLLAAVAERRGDDLAAAGGVVIEREQAFFDKAIKAHIAWRTRLQVAINGGEVPDRTRACDHTACELGRWLTGDRSTLERHPAYAGLCSHHQAFHTEVGRIIDLVGAKRLDEAKQALMAGALAQHSRDTISHINRLRPSRRHDAGGPGKGLLLWSPQFATGHTGIDNQHRELFRMTGELHTAMIDGRGRAAVGQLIAFLADYTVRHFADEEEVMRAAGYADLAKHQAVHRNLLGQVTDLQRRFAAGETLKTMEVSEFLAGWLRQHILHVDHAYIPALKANGAVT